MAMNLLVKVSLLVKASPENSPSHSQQLDQFQGILVNPHEFLLFKLTCNYIKLNFFYSLKKLGLNINE